MLWLGYQWYRVTVEVDLGAGRVARVEYMVRYPSVPYRVRIAPVDPPSRYGVVREN